MYEYEKKEVLLSAKDVNLEFKDSNSCKKVLKNINLEIKNIVRPGVTQGQVVSLIGRSGSGKTCLLRLLAGLSQPTSGTVSIGVNQKPVEPGSVGLVPQNYYLFPWRKINTLMEMSAKKNPAYAGNKRYIMEAIDTYAKAFDIQDHMEKYPAQLSGGQRQRASIAQQLLNGSEFLFMDEPFSGLDTLMIDKTTRLISNIALADELKTIIIVSHDLSNSVAISDTVFIISNKDSTDGVSTVVKEIDLIQRDLAWRTDIKEQPVFHETLKEIKSLI